MERIAARRLSTSRPSDHAGRGIVICPGDGGMGCEGYRPLALRLQEHARSSVFVFDGLLGCALQGRPAATAQELAAGCLAAAARERLAPPLLIVNMIVNMCCMFITCVMSLLACSLFNTN